ncbi:MAG: hypothetical protein QOG59_1667 [Solirubrobacteraceae bacterium]|jgi:hypothetical protein|nr:hypothetical protein [Solirubrobacteraceae bacterium]
MSFPVMPPSRLSELAATSRDPDPGPRDDGEAQDEVVTFPGSATWVAPGPSRSPGHGRGELNVSSGTVTFALESGERTFAHRADTLELTRTPLAALVVLQDGDTRVRVTVSGPAQRKLAGALSDAGVLA